ncbi:MAG: GGDEF domain-containing protein [Gammaproteobacteria bacterium]|nr:GGDEF domain-containing protein [Gammaproteobacteria bacterium]MCW8986537.1 GGDEF domain-containing protein [Gammaproteobacteria bacterium]MCW9030760.1 GGDEF domain-containing protein [Gammaproteobacteria bacterium]
MLKTVIRSFHIYLISTVVSLALTCGVGYFQIKVTLKITTFEPVYLVAPGIIGLFFGLLVARVIVLNHKLKWYAIRDPLTQTFNHGYYKRILHDWTHEDSDFSLILFDIDDFKEINDEYGHQIGDQTLVRVCELVSETKRLYDVFARHGGEEFVILTPRTDLSEAADNAKRICKIIAEASMPSGHKLTCSFGVAQFRIDCDTPDSIFERADNALYESKKRGKNRVTLEEPAK